MHAALGLQLNTYLFSKTEKQQQALVAAASFRYVVRVSCKTPLCTLRDTFNCLVGHPFLVASVTSDVGVLRCQHRMFGREYSLTSGRSGH